MTLPELLGTLSRIADLPAEARPGAIGALAAAQATLLALAATPTSSTQAEALVTADVMAGELGVPVTWLRAQARARKLPHFRPGKYIQFNRAEVLAALRIEPDHRMERLGTAEKPNTGAGLIPLRFTQSQRRTAPAGSVASANLGGCPRPDAGGTRGKRPPGSSETPT